MSDKINYAWPVTSENTVVLQQISSKLNAIKEVLKDKKIIIFGAGIRGCCILNILQKQGYKNIVFCDNNIEKQGAVINSFDIISFKDAIDNKENKVFFISPENAGNMKKQLVQVGLKENTDWFSFEFSSYDNYIKEYQRPVDNHLLAMGDCAFTHVALEDKNTDSIGGLIRNKVGSEHCKVLDMHGMGQQAYYHIAHSLINSGERPKVFLLLLMIETMAAKVPIMPRTQHSPLIKSLVNVSGNTLQDFRDYADLTEERFNRFQVESFVSLEDKLNQETEKLYMEINYLFKFRENTEGVIYLKKTIKMMNDADIPVLLYIPPVNFYQGEQLFGADFKERYHSNFEKLYTVLDKEDLKYEIADASYLLNIEDFAAPNTIDETCNYDGRIKLMNFLSQFEILKQFLK